MIVRFEPWGAWVKLESMPALVALDRDGVRALGLDGGARWLDDGVPSPPIEASVAVTSRCAVGCEGCYLDARPDGVEPPREAVLAALDALRDAGVFTVSFGGGEPTTRVDLGVLADEARRRGLTPVLTTSGAGLSTTKAARLASFAQVNVSYDGEGEDYRRVRGVDGAAHAEAAIALLAELGVRVGVNVVLTRATFPRLESTLARARALGATEAQLLRYKPAGRAATLDYLARRLTAEQAAEVGPTLRRIVAAHASRPGEFSVRIDCAMVPFLSADADLADLGATLSRMGVLGCEAGGALAAVTIDGAIAPCSFAPPTSLSVSDLARGYAGHPELARWRGASDAPQEPCASCEIRAVCKGGCKVVSSFIDGAHGPDPECPRVRAHRARASAP